MEDRLAVAVVEAGNRGEIVHHAGRDEQIPAVLVRLSDRDVEVRAAPHRVGDALMPALDAVRLEFRPSDRQELERRDAVAREIPVQRPSPAVARLTQIAHEHAPPATSQHERGAQTRRPAAGDDHVEHGGRGPPILPLPPLLPYDRTMQVSDFDFDLPAELIAQEPAARGESRLLHLDRGTGAIAHTRVAALPDLLRPGDLVVVNDTRVFPARLLGHRVPSGGAVECLLIRKIEPAGVPDDLATAARGETGDIWEALMHPGQKLRPGGRVVFDGRPALHGEILERRFFGRRLIRLWTEDGSPVDSAVDAIGHVPLPPYIRRQDRPDDRDRYQTVFARARGSVAAPTAGLHFTPELLAALGRRGVDLVRITLHVGYGTFQPVRVDQVEQHRLEAEHYEISAASANAINRALAERRRVVAVGTTTTRTLEAVGALHDGRLEPGAGATDLFIYPGFRFRVISGLLTNFHLPKSSLLMLVSAFAGREHVLGAYRAAVAERYRFYSYGDAMLIL